MQKKQKKAFTIVELVIVIAVIAILAAVLIPTFVNITNKAKENKDTQLVRNLNTALATDKAISGEHTTMQSALDAAESFGYSVDKINASATDNEILWDSVNDVFCYLKDGAIEYIPNSVDAGNALDVNNYKLWKIYGENDTIPAATAQTYSIYYNGAAWAEQSDEHTVSVGFDAGNTMGIEKVTYTGIVAVKEVVIRTNSASTTLTIDDESEGSIYHYGSAGALNIIECHTASYHEYGQVAFAEIATGRIVLESGSEMKHIHINANEANGFDTVIIADNGAKALPETISRDEVTVASETLVVKVESDGTSESVYVYPSAAIGTTQKTATQNASVVSELGQLVLDNESGSKALSEAAKTETKTELVNEAEEKENAVIYNLTTGEYYGNIYDAIEAVPENTKTTLILLKNVTGVSNRNYEIKAGQNIIFDLNGHTMNTVAREGATAYTIQNKGTLTIKDNSDKLKNGTGTGKLEMNALNPDTQGIPGYASNLITNRGNLTIESGWLHNASSDGYAAYAIDSYANGCNVSLVINGGKITSNGSSSIRQAIYTNTTNDVTINGGIIGSYWIQNYGNASTSANGTLNVKGGEFLYSVRLDTGWSQGGGYNIKAENVSVTIEGGTFNKEIKVYENGNGGTIEITGGTFPYEEWDATVYGPYAADELVSGYGKEAWKTSSSYIFAENPSDGSWTLTEPAGNSMDGFPFAEGYHGVVSSDRTTFTVVKD